MYAPPGQVWLVDWHIPVFPGGVQVMDEEEVGEEVDSSGQHLMLESPGQ